MYKPSKNPVVEELTKSYKERSYRIGDLPWIFVDGQKRCYWCGDSLKSRHHAARYCKDPNCSLSAFAWANPQKENGLFFLLVKQDWKCAICQYDYKKFAQEKIINRFYGTHSKNDFVVFNYYLMVRLRSMTEQRYKPEVDHIIPISKGGAALGLENHQVICYADHKAKSKVDNSGPRNKK